MLPSPRRLHPGLLGLPLLALAAMPTSASALELVWDGHYRAEAHLYDSLSLSKDNANSEGAASWMDHRARLRPGFLLSEHVGLYTQLDLLPLVMFGEDPGGGVDLTTGDSLPLAYDQTVVPPTTTDGAATLQNLQVTRLWGEAWFPRAGTLRFGRVPINWGAGMVFNDGNDAGDDAGDTEDRVSFTGLAGPVYVMGAFGVPYGGLINENDGMKSVTASVAHLAEQAGVGFYNTYRWQRDGDDRLQVWTGDLWGRAELGPLQVEGEFAAVVGSGDLDTGANDVSISAFGGHLSGELAADRLMLGVAVGIAGGDKNTDDKKLHTFAYDPDFDMALLMFEQPMPVLQASVANDTNEGRATGAVRTRNGLSNAAWLRPSVGFQIRDDLSTRLAFFAAQTARLPEEDRDNKGYGSEIDLSVDYRPFDHFRVNGTGGIFFPGKYYSGFEDEDLGGDFGRTAIGTRLQAIVEF